MKISIIIPIYNVERYIEDCLKSVLAQIDEEIELIMVNDGSTDGSFKYCRKYMEQNKDLAIKLITQNNAGLSAARNAGLRIAEGEYIIFLDADDMLTENALLELKKYIFTYPMVDIFYFDALIKDELHNDAVKGNYNRKNKVTSRVLEAKEYFAKYYLDPLILSSCLCLYRKELITNSRLEFPEGKLHEDNMFSFQAVMRAGKVMYIPKDFYIRRYREQSITTREITLEQISDLLYIYTENIRFANEIEMDTCLYTAVIFFFYKRINSILSLIKNISTEKELIKKLLVAFIEFISLMNPDQYTLTSIRIMDSVSELVSKYFWLSIDCTFMEADGRKKRQLYQELYHKMPFAEERKVGIYGLGRHTENLLQWYQNCGGTFKAEIYYIDSIQESFQRKYENCEVINIRDAEQYVDCIVISSYIYHAEMRLLCEEYIKEKDIEIIDIYEMEKIAIF